MHLGPLPGFAPAQKVKSVFDFAALDNLIAYYDFTNSSKYTFKSGTIVDSIAPSVGSIALDDYATGQEPRYDTTAFNGRGGLSFTAVNQAIRYSTNFTATSTQTIAFVYNMADFGGNNMRFFSFGNSTNRSTSASLLQSTIGRITYQNDQSNASDVVFQTEFDGVVCVVLRYTNASTLDVFINDLNVTDALNPSDVYNTFNRIYLGDTGAGPLDGYFAEFLHTSDALSNAEITALLNYWRKKYIPLQHPLRIIESGQSNAENKFGTYAAAGHKAFISAALMGASDVIHANGATDSSAADKEGTGDSNYWWDNALESKGAAYTGQFANAYLALRAHAAPANWIIWSQGETDANTIGMTYTKAEYKAALLAIFNQMRADIAPDLRVLIEPIGRASTFINTGGWQSVREVQQELAAEHDWIDLGPEKYDLNLVELVHLDQAGYETIATRNANKILSLTGLAPSAGYDGPRVANATYIADNNTISVNIAHDDGTDFAPASGIEGFYVTVSSIAATISSAIRTNATTITLTLSASISSGSTVKLWYAHDAMLGVNPSNLVKDSNDLPLRAIANLTVTQV
ncbi:MAG: hypothetical protein L6Q57_09110 [Alphaproteobacteria bacterium]|nr:hypothetical protein [Alphaproteobacteria bacterium]